jgi:hypothetical protein
MATKTCLKLADKLCCLLCDYSTSRKNDYDKHLLTQKHKSCEKSTHKFYCEHCDYSTSKSSSYNKHLLTRKHKSCSKLSEPDIATNVIILELIKENQELVKETKELKKMVIDISSKPNVVNNYKKFNLNVFLNDTCKDALNLTDFVSSIRLQLSDLEGVGSGGFVTGISSIIIKNLNALDINKRPVHCSDFKREIMYIKDQDKWEKEKDEKEKIKNVIKNVAYKNMLKIMDWRQEHPGCEYSDNKNNDEYLKIVNESMGAFTDEENAGYLNKIIKNVAKEVTIEKE